MEGLEKHYKVKM